MNPIKHKCDFCLSDECLNNRCRFWINIVGSYGDNYSKNSLDTSMIGKTKYVCPHEWEITAVRQMKHDTTIAGIK